MTKREALEKMRDHWLWIAKAAGTLGADDNHWQLKMNYFWTHNLRVPYSGCYACEYDNQYEEDCTHCPVEWRNSQGCGSGEYMDFMLVPTAANARAVADLAIKALEALDV